MHCSIILPVHNEGQTILRNLPSLDARIRSLLGGMPYEIILVDNGSRDGTEARVRGLLKSGVVFLSCEKKGRGPAVRLGVSAARGRYICTLSIDRAWDESFVPEAIALLETGLDVVYGQKSHIRSSVQRPVHRQFASLVIRCLVSRLFRFPRQDTQCVRAFRREAVSFNHLMGDYNYFSETEFFLRAMRENLKIAAIPVRVVDRRKDSKVRLASILEYLREALHFRFTEWRGISP